MIVKSIEFRVRYAETDQMGYVHHGNYAQYFEMGRIEWLRTLGISYKKMEQKNIILPVVSLSTSFKKPAKYDDNLTLKTAIKQLPSAKIIFIYELVNSNREILTTGETTLVFVDAQKNRPMRCPDYIMEAIEKEIKTTLPVQ